MSMRKLPLALAFTLAFGAATAVAATPRLGQPITEADITAWNIEALPDGKGLPPGAAPPSRAQRSIRRSARYATARTA